jgi:glyoxylase-like metal-dependent hydrolase (beta-lactamase superfamily II)
MQAGAKNEMSLQKSLCPLEDVEDLLLNLVHVAKGEDACGKAKINFRTRNPPGIGTRMTQESTVIPLEDELGDVLDKAMNLAGLKPEETAARSGIELSRLLDALDWRSELGGDELRRLAATLGLNEVGLCSLGAGAYPLPETGGLPFCVHPLRMAHGIGVVNAYLVSQCRSEHGVLFDTGPNLQTLLAAWPARIRHLDAVFITHVEPEHAGGLCEVMRHFNVKQAFVPVGAKSPCGVGMAEGSRYECRAFRVTALSTPGHSAAHNGYVVETPVSTKGRHLLVSGDLLYAASVGCAFHCKERLRESIRKVVTSQPADTVVAPGHGPLTTIGNEHRYNPFIV